MKGRIQTTDETGRPGKGERNRQFLAGVAVGLTLALAAAGGYLVIASRAHGSDVSLPTPAARPSLAPSASPSAPGERWLVAKVTRPVVVRTRPSADAAERVRLDTVNPNGFPTILLVRRMRVVDGVTWYNVWLPIRPNGSRGWLREGNVATYPTVAKIVVDLSERRLYAYRGGKLMGKFPVAVGSSQYPTPTGFFYINQKLRPPSSGGPYGVIALGISAFQPRLTYWPQEGPVAIHGTNEDWLIGKAISHGCIRMHNRDILKVNDWVPAGSPVIVKK